MTATAELALDEVEPEFKIVTVYQSPTHNVILTEDEELTSAVLPGFCCDLREIFTPSTKR